MPYSIWVTAAPDFATVVADKRSEASVLPVLDRAHLDDALDVLDTRPHAGDGAWWFTHPQGEPWFSLFTVPHTGPLRHIELSASFTDRNFPRNMADMFDMALRLAKRLGARVFEESAGREVTAASVDDLLEFDGDFAQGLMRFWKSGRDALVRELRAPLEFPLGAIDSLSEFFLFELPVEKVPSIAEIVAMAPAASMVAHPLEHSVVLADRQSEQGVVRVLKMDRAVGVRPYWGDTGFAALAKHTLAAVDGLAAGLSVVPRYYGTELTAERRGEIDAHVGGLGVEYVEWLGILDRE